MPTYTTALDCKGSVLSAHFLRYRVEQSLAPPQDVLRSLQPALASSEDLSGCRGGRKVIIVPDVGDAWAPAKPRPDETLIRALARAHRWKRMLEEGRYRSAAEIAEAEGVTRSFVNRLLRLTLLAPDISRDSRRTAAERVWSYADHAERVGAAAAALRIAL